MKIDKAHTEFQAVDMKSGWSVPHGYPAGIEEKLLSGVLDERNKQGFRTRLLRFQPGVYTTKPFVHDYWEEVYLAEGDLIVGCDEHGQGGERFEQHTYACRPPKTFHGPFKSEGGCVLVEMHYYAPSHG